MSSSEVTQFEIDACDLSCQALARLDPNSTGVPIWRCGERHEPVVHYAEEMTRRGEWHVYCCEQIGHRGDPDLANADQSTRAAHWQPDDQASLIHKTLSVT